MLGKNEVINPLSKCEMSYFHQVVSYWGSYFHYMHKHNMFYFTFYIYIMLFKFLLKT